MPPKNHSRSRVNISIECVLCLYNYYHHCVTPSQCNRQQNKHKILCVYVIQQICLTSDLLHQSLCLSRLPYDALGSSVTALLFFKRFPFITNFKHAVGFDRLVWSVITFYVLVVFFFCLLLFLYFQKQQQNELLDNLDPPFNH